MRVLVACECSGVVRRAFRARGHEAWSVDLREAEDGEDWYHVVGDVRHALDEGEWDLMIAHPPCTHLAASGNRWRAGKDPGEVRRALNFARDLILERRVEKVCVENPVGILSSEVMEPSQIVEPWWFGDPVRKKTCLWTRGLCELRRDMVVEPWDESLWRMGERRGRGVERSRTFPGMARAMAEQWG